MLIGLISDTHGYVDPRLGSALAGVDAIIHAGDVGGAHVLETLRTIAPLYAVYGNNDERLGGLGLQLREDFELDGVQFHLVHHLPHARVKDRTQVVVFGHSHRTLIEERFAVLYINPGAAGRVGFHKLQTVATMNVENGAIAEPRIIELGARQPRGGV
jgi:hypothetical protein